MTLQLHRAERADALVRGLAEVLSVTPDDPFTRDVVAVPSKGVERWIAQSLSSTLGAQDNRADGICANVVFPSVARLVRDAVTAASGIAADEDPWAEHRLSWTLLEVIDDCATESWCITLGRHLGLDRGVDQGRRMAVAQKLAGLFTSYAAQRPAMIRAWAGGQDTDGQDDPLAPDLTWQPELWRRLRAGIDSPSPAERLTPACARLHAEPDIVDLPQRLSLFGPTRLTTDQLQVIYALAERRDVHLWLPHPSHGLWARLAETEPAVTSRRDDPTVNVPQHPLVRSLGRDARELQLRLAAHTRPATDEHLPSDPDTGTLLNALQHDIHDDRPPTPHALGDQDVSIQVHACHGRQRQVEVLREVLLGMLADDPTLELRDIIVMCPDIESYAPLIAASFGLSGGDDEAVATGAHPGHRLTVRLADRSLRQTNPVLSVAARLLELADSRLTVSEVLDLAAMPPVRRRFKFDDDDLERVGDWVRRSGVRWGLDAESRRRFGLATVQQNTWQTGLDRLLVGVTMDEDDLRTLGLALPLDDVDSTEIDLAGRVAELLDRLTAAITELTRGQTIQDWVTSLTAALESLVDVTPTDAWQLTQARWQLTDALSSAAEHSADTTLELSDVRALLAERLRGRPSRANFRTGHLTMCTMVPMRSVPHRVVCLLGLDDGVFPRGTRIDGDDVLARRPRVGERDARAEDRQLFLDAILAAKERLVILYTGADERTGAIRPPAVPLGELLDVLDRTATVVEGRVRDHIEVRHPLQSFDARNFVPGELTRTHAFSFDRASYDGSRALLTERHPKPPFLPAPLSDALPSPPRDDGQPDDVLEVDALVRFLEHPVKQFLRHRLGLSTVEEEEEATDALPVDPDALEKWAVGDRLLTAALAGIDRGDAVRAEWLRGHLPPGRLGRNLVDPIADEVTALVKASALLRVGTPAHEDVNVTLASGTALVGTVPGIYDDQLVRVVYSKLGPKHRLRAWVQLLALVAKEPDRSWTAATVGRGPGGGVAVSELSGLTAEAARKNLDALVAVYREGMRAPLPLPAKTACSYAERRRSGVAVPAAVAFAGKAWRNGSGQNEYGDFTDPEHQRVFGDVTLPDLLDSPPAASDTDWPNEPHRFGQLARSLWTPLLDAEVIR